MARGNPIELFPTDDPIPSKELIGRADDITEIATQLQVGANVILAAPRRTGKTTVCDAVLERLAADDEYYTVKVDLFFIADIEQLAEALIEETVQNRPLLRKALFSAKKTGKTFYESISLTVGAKLAGGEYEGLDFSVLPALRKDPVAYLDYALLLPEQIAAADGKRLIVLIDEFQGVEQIGENHKRGWAMTLKKKMRASFLRSSHVSFLFAGSIEHMMRTIFGASDEPFYNFGTFHDLGPILPEEWESGFLERFERDQTTIESDALDSIISKGNGHPRATMLIAQRAHISSIIAGTKHITRALADAAYNDALRAERPKHEAWAERIQNLGSSAINRVALRSVVAIAKQGAPYAKARYPSEIGRALLALQNAGFIEKEGKQGWRIVDPLFEAYLTSIDLHTR